TPVYRNSPRLNQIVGAWYSAVMVIVRRLVECLGGVGPCRLDLSQFINASRLENALVSIPLPIQSEPGVGHWVNGASNLSLFPGLPSVGGYFHFANGASARPGQTGDLVDTGARQLLPS